VPAAVVARNVRSNPANGGRKLSGRLIRWAVALAVAVSACLPTSSALGQEAPRAGLVAFDSARLHLSVTWSLSRVRARRGESFLFSGRLTMTAPESGSIECNRGRFSIPIRLLRSYDGDAEVIRDETARNVSGQEFSAEATNFCQSSRVVGYDFRAVVTNPPDRIWTERVAVVLSRFGSAATNMTGRWGVVDLEGEKVGYWCPAIDGFVDAWSASVCIPPQVTQSAAITEINGGVETIPGSGYDRTLSNYFLYQRVIRPDFPFYATPQGFYTIVGLASIPISGGAGALLAGVATSESVIGIAMDDQGCKLERIGATLALASAPFTLREGHARVGASVAGEAAQTQVEIQC
jgi:hypothetical protein